MPGPGALLEPADVTVIPCSCREKQVHGCGFCGDISVVEITDTYQKTERQYSNNKKFNEFPYHCIHIVGYISLYSPMLVIEQRATIDTALCAILVSLVSVTLTCQYCPHWKDPFQPLCRLCMGCTGLRSEGSVNTVSWGRINALDYSKVLAHVLQAHGKMT